MGYTTQFEGRILTDRPLDPVTADFLTRFAGTRRMGDKPYVVDRPGFMGQDPHPGENIDENRPPPGQPSLWCQWVPSDDLMGIEWDGGEKFYSSQEWMAYLIEHFLKPNPRHSDLPGGYILNGSILAQGENIHDRWNLIVTNNVVTTRTL